MIEFDEYFAPGKTAVPIWATYTDQTPVGNSPNGGDCN